MSGLGAGDPLGPMFSERLMQSCPQASDSAPCHPHRLRRPSAGCVVGVATAEAVGVNGLAKALQPVMQELVALCAGGLAGRLRHSKAWPSVCARHAASRPCRSAAGQERLCKRSHQGLGTKRRPRHLLRAPVRYVGNALTVSSSGRPEGSNGGGGLEPPDVGARVVQTFAPNKALRARMRTKIGPTVSEFREEAHIECPQPLCGTSSSPVPSSRRPFRSDSCARLSLLAWGRSPHIDPLYKFPELTPLGFQARR